MEFNRFDDVPHKPLRVFNRVAMASNLLEDFGEDVSEEYISLFTQKERINIHLLADFIQHNGVKTAREVCTRDMEIKYDVGEG